MTHSMTLPFPPQVDGSRVAAQAGAIALNAALLLALLAPIAPPLIESATTRNPDVVIIRPVKPKPVVPIPVPVVDRPKRLDPEPVQPQQLAPPIEQPVVVPEGEITVDPPIAPPDSTHRETTIAPPIAPAQGAHLQYRSAPPPPYPRDALRTGLTGTVLLEVLVDVDGRPLEVSVVQSSGHRVLDQAARKQVLTRWRFEPAMQHGRAVQALGRVPVEFKLD